MQTKIKRRQPIKQKKQEFSFPLEKQNFIIVGIGILCLIIGYILMSENSVDGFLPTVVAPILLVAGYCVIIPYGILKNFSGKDSASTDISDGELSSQTGSNIKTS